MSTQSSQFSNTSLPFHLAEQVAAEQKVRDVKISPDGKKVLYQVQSFYKADGTRTHSQLWIARTNESQSARQLTSGDFNDRSGVWHPDGKRILFLSNRIEGASLVFCLKLDDIGHPKGEPEVISTDFGKKGVQAFDVSPDGKYIALMAIDETTEQQMAKLKEKNDSYIYGEKTGLSRIRLFSFSAKNIVNIQGVRSDMHIESFSWSPDSKQLLYRLRQDRSTEYSEMKVLVERIGIDGQSAIATTVESYPRSPSGQNIWLPSGHIASLQNYEPSNSLDARTLHVSTIQRQCDGESKNKHRLYGQVEDAVRIVDMRTNFNDLENEGMVAVEVCKDVDTNIDVVGFSQEGVKTLFTLFRTDNDAIWFGAWDAKRVIDDDGAVAYVVAAVLSSGVNHQPPNVWTGVVTGKSGGLIPNKVQLSSHLQWLLEAPDIKTEVIRWSANDGMRLNGLLRYPPGYQVSDGPLPTVLFIHGGPYRRDIPDYMPYFCNWRELFAWAGYLVISPNYRGSQGRGHAFAHAASKGIGELDWPDCESMVDEVIRLGLADPDRLGIAGWSHGGSLTAWGVTRTKDRFKAAVIGAGATSWEGMVMESGSPELEMQIGQISPWDDNVVKDISNMASPIRMVSGIETAVLLLHGEKDERVPIGQAIGFWRGLKRRAGERCRNATELVIYPREPHGFGERKHAEDVMRRVLLYFERYILKC